MSTRHHVRTLCDRLTPAGLAPLLEVGAGLGADAAGLRALLGALDALKIGGGAVAMHERTSWGEPTTPLGELPDHEALLLVGLSLRASALAPRQASPEAAAAALSRLLLVEPDFFDQLLLELSRRYHVMPAFAAVLRGHAEGLRAAERQLREQDQRLHPDAGAGLLAGLQRLLGRGGAPWRQLRLLTAVVALGEGKP